MSAAEQTIPEELLANYLRYKEDRWAFLTECCFTRDEVDAENPIKLMPKHEYLRLYVKVWERERLLAVPKSRRMTMSWTNIALNLHDAIFHKVRNIAFVSKKEDDAAELVGRAEFIYDHIPADKFPKALLPKKETRAKPPVLSFPELSSKIQGYPMGADQLRQFTFSSIFGDECAFWEEAQKFYSASYPTIEGGGRMSLVSSRSPGFFQRLCYDALDEKAEIIEGTAEKKFPFGDSSVELWKNPKNKFLVFDLHYTAHAGKRSREWRDAVASSMPTKDFLMEYERNWEVFAGRPVYDDFSRTIHVAKYEQEPHLGLPILLGFDFGLTPACIAAQLRGNQLIILREYVAEGQGIQTFCPSVMNDLAQRYPEWNDWSRDYRVFIDPAGFQKAQTDARTCANVMNECGLRNIAPGPIDWESRKTAVEHFLLSHTREGAGLILHEKDCPVLTKGFAGGYQYPDKADEIEPLKPRPKKNRYSHPHDALQYLCGGARFLKTETKPTSIPRPEYSFTAKA